MPFDLAEVVTNLRQALSAAPGGRFDALGSILRLGIYYFLRPLLAVGVRKHLQRMRLRGWENIRFLVAGRQRRSDHARHDGVALRRAGVTEIPFIWFCRLRNDDPRRRGSYRRRVLFSLTDLDESFGIRSAFQMIPRSPFERSVVDS